MSEDRKLKYAYKRIPKEKVNYRQLTDAVAVETGYSKEKVGYIIDHFVKEVVDNMHSGKCCVIDNLGMFYRMIRPSRNMVDFNNQPNPEYGGKSLGTKGMEVKVKKVGACWIPNFRFHKNTFQKFKELPNPTKEEVDNLYED